MPRGTQDPASVSIAFRLRASHPLRMSFPEHSTMLQCSYLCGPTTPTLQQKRQAKAEVQMIIRKKKIYPILSLYFYLFLFSVSFVVGLVWALPRSLAATEGISLDFFSSRY